MQAYWEQKTLLYNDSNSMHFQLCQAVSMLKYNPNLSPLLDIFANKVNPTNPQGP